MNVIDGRPGIDIVLDGEYGQVIKVTEYGYPIYTGQTTITPLRNITQILPTANTTVLDAIVVNPIPSNYGLITWDGSKLTIS